MKKNVVIIILAILVLSLSGYVVYDKVINNSNPKVKDDESLTDNKESNKRESYEYVGNSFSGIIVDGWPEGEQREPGEPEEFVKKADIPKILIETEVTNKINEKIYNDYSNAIKIIKGETTGRYSSIKVTYDYTIVKDILFILVTESFGGPRSGGETIHTGYYYDIANDKELTLEEVCTKINLSIELINDENVNSIEAIIPLRIGAYHVYYGTSDYTCGQMACEQNVYVDMN